MNMRSLLALLATSFGICILSADTVTLTSTRSSAQQSCGNYQDCQPFSLLIPQFDPARGLPVSIAWSFSDSQTYYGGYNDIGASQFGDFTWTTTEGDGLSLPLGVQASNTQTLAASVNPYNTRNVSSGGWWQSGVVQASGVATASDAWVGLGEVLIQVTPFLFASDPQGDGAAQVNTSLTSVMDEVMLTVTADYGDPPPSAPPSPPAFSRFSRLVTTSSGPVVPEPKLEFLIVLVVLAGISWNRITDRKEVNK